MTTTQNVGLQGEPVSQSNKNLNHCLNFINKHLNNSETTSIESRFVVTIIAMKLYIKMCDTKDSMCYFGNSQ